VAKGLGLDVQQTAETAPTDLSPNIEFNFPFSGLGLKERRYRTLLHLRSTSDSACSGATVHVDGVLRR
jgi:hypothetical protein